jgi:hypothetical protein
MNSDLQLRQRPNEYTLERLQQAIRVAGDSRKI